MKKIFEYRNLLIFASLVFGITLIINLISLSIKLTGQFTIYPYLVVMLAAVTCGGLGFIKENPKLLGVCNILWFISLAFNIAAIIFVLPIVILNILGRNKMMNKLELAGKLKMEEKNETDKLPENRNSSNN